MSFFSRPRHEPEWPPLSPRRRPKRPVGDAMEGAILPEMTRPATATPREAPLNPVRPDRANLNPGEILFEVGDVLSRIPPEILVPGEIDRSEELRLRLDDLFSDITRGRATVRLAKVVAARPELFTIDAGSAPELDLYLPLQKLVDQINSDDDLAPVPTVPSPVPAVSNSTAPADATPAAAMDSPASEATVAAAANLEVASSPEPEPDPPHPVSDAMLEKIAPHPLTDEVKSAPPKREESETAVELKEGAPDITEPAIAIVLPQPAPPIIEPVERNDAPPKSSAPEPELEPAPESAKPEPAPAPEPTPDPSAIPLPIPAAAMAPPPILAPETSRPQTTRPFLVPPRVVRAASSETAGAKPQLFPAPDATAAEEGAEGKDYAAIAARVSGWLGVDGCAVLAAEAVQTSGVIPGGIPFAELRQVADRVLAFSDQLPRAGGLAHATFTFARETITILAHCDRLLVVFHHQPLPPATIADLAAAARQL